MHCGAIKGAVANTTTKAKVICIIIEIASEAFGLADESSEVDVNKITEELEAFTTVDAI